MGKKDQQHTSPPLIFNSYQIRSGRGVRQPDRSGDAGPRALASIQSSPHTEPLPSFTTSRRTLRKREMCSVVVVVPNVFVHQPPQMEFISYDHTVEQIPTAVANPALRNAALPGTAEAGSFRLDAQSLDCTDHFIVKVRGPVKDQVLRGGVVGERFPQLLRNARTARMSGNVQVQNVPPVMRNNKEAVQQANG